MPEYERHHYVQKQLLKNFAIKSDNGKYKINVIDITESTVSVRNIERAFYVKNLYDVDGDDSKKLEKDLNTKIETPFNEILQRIMADTNKVVITRKELYIIKKYLLVQLYRNYKNSLGYTGLLQGKKELSEYNRQEGESKLAFWKREMQTILDTEWEALIRKETLVGVKKHATKLNSGFLMFCKTGAEFLINDIGFTIERIPVKVNIPAEEYVKMAKQYGQETYGVDDFDEFAKAELENNTSYMDNYIWFSVSTDFAIVAVDGVWKQIYACPELMIELGLPPSPMLSNHYSLPKNKFVNQHLIRDAESLEKYKSQNDRYTYKVHELSEDETILINKLYLNEAHQYVGFKTTQGILPSISKYNMLKTSGYGNMKKDYSKIELLLKQ